MGSTSVTQGHTVVLYCGVYTSCEQSIEQVPILKVQYSLGVTELFVTFYYAMTAA